MMRCAQKWPRLLIFRRIETLPLKTVFGDVPITWNTEKRAIVAKLTTPLPITVTPDEWSRMRRASIEADSWLVAEKASESEWWDWWE